MQTVNNKPGYKQTKLGLLPNDWDVRTLQEMGEVLKGLTYSPKDVNEDGVLVLRSSNIQNGQLSFLDNVYVNVHENEFNPVQFGDILICVRNGSKRLIGKNTVINKAIGGCAFGAFMSVYRSKNYRFISQYFNSTFYHKEVYKNLGATINSINSGDLKKFKIPYPPDTERIAIATCLTTWDKAITTAEKLIVQLEQRKKGLMQQLLTGKKRLPGFTGEWKDVKIKDIGKVIRGASPRPKGDIRYYGGEVPRLMVADVTRDGKYVYPRIDFLTTLGATKSRPCKAGTLTVVCSGTVGIPSFLGIDACIHDGFLAIIDLKDDLVHADYLYNQLFRLKERIERDATHGGVFTNLTTEILKNFSLQLPEFSEQTAIANVLSQADETINHHKTYLSHLQAQKKGLMQALLTGKKRLPL